MKNVMFNATKQDGEEEERRDMDIKRVKEKGKEKAKEEKCKNKKKNV